MEVEVTVDAESLRDDEMRRLAKGYLVFVALDPETLKPIPIAPLITEMPEECERAKAAEHRKENRIAEKAQEAQWRETAIDESDNPATVQRTMTPDDANIHQNIFGGVILELIHTAAEKVAFGFAKSPVIAVRQDRMSFEQPAYIGEEVKAQAVITRTWRTSMEIQVDVVARDHKTQEQRKVASSFMVFVAQNTAGLPTLVPLFVPQTEKQILRWEQADLRRAVRLQERKVPC